jgi:hypothetical protein
MLPPFGAFLVMAVKGPVIYCDEDRNLFHDDDDDDDDDGDDNLSSVLTVLQVTFQLTPRCRDGSPS